MPIPPRAVDVSCRRAVAGRASGYVAIERETFHLGGEIATCILVAHLGICAENLEWVVSGADG